MLLLVLPRRLRELGFRYVGRGRGFCLETIGMVESGAGGVIHTVAFIFLTAFFSVCLTLRYCHRLGRKILPRIDPNAPCPSCGNRNGELRCIRSNEGGKDTAFVAHRCKVCSAEWAEPSIVPLEHWELKKPVRVAKK